MRSDSDSILQIEPLWMRGCEEKEESIMTEVFDLSNGNNGINMNWRVHRWSRFNRKR